MRHTAFVGLGLITYALVTACSGDPTGPQITFTVQGSVTTRYLNVDGEHYRISGAYIQLYGFTRPERPAVQLGATTSSGGSYSLTVTIPTSACAAGPNGPWIQVSKDRFLGESVDIDCSDQTVDLRLEAPLI